MKQETKKRIQQINNGIVPKGYKKSKAGIIPIDWDIITLKEISTPVHIKNTDGKISTTFTNSATKGVVKQTEYFDKQISNDDNTCGYYIVNPNDYIYNPRISSSAPCGPINRSRYSEPGIVSPLYTVFSLIPKLKENRFFEYYFSSDLWHRYMFSVANFGARHDRMNITTIDFYNMPILFPKNSEQEKIAKILSTQDKVIELKEKLIEQKRLEKGVIVEQVLFLDDSTISECKIGEICDTFSGGTPSRKIPEYYNGDIP